MTGPARPDGTWVRLRDAVDAAFDAWGHRVYRNAWLVIGLSLATVAGLATQLPKIEIDTSTEGFLPEDDPVRVAYDRFRHQFGRDEMVLVAVEGEEVFDFEFLERLRSLHDDLEASVPQLEAVTSLINARDTRGVGDELVVGDLLETWPEGDAALAALRARAMANPLYRDQLLSADGRLTTIVVETDAYSSLGEAADALAGFDAVGEGGSGDRPFLTGEENARIVEAIQTVAARHQAPGFEILIAGNPVMIDQIMRAMLADMGGFAVIALGVIGAFLAFLFRSVTAVALSIVVSVLAVISSLSLMGVIGMPLTSPTQIMPSFLLAVGVGNSVHVLVIYFQARGRGDDAEAAIAYALAHSGLAIVMTAMTTAAGLLSFASAEIAPIADVGIICPLGTMIALLFTLTLLPALISVLPMDRAAPKAAGGAAALRRLPVRCGSLASAHPVATVAVWTAVFAVSLTGAAGIAFSHYPMGWFAEDHPLRVASERINEELNGSVFLEGLVDSRVENGLHDPELLRRIDGLQQRLLEVRTGQLFIGKTLSLADVNKEIHQALNENRSEFYAIPDTRELVAQELLLFENSGSDDLEDFVDSRFQVARVTMKLPMVDAIGFGDLIDQVEPAFAEFLGERADFTITGNWTILGETVDALTVSLARTYVFAFLMIAPMMMLLLGSLRLGALSMLPNVGAIVVTVGYMGWAGVPLDAFTLMVGSVALGLAVDDTIHFMHNFRRAYGRSGDAPASVRATMESTGQALLFTSLVLAAGFFIYMFASMKNLYNFGFLTGLAIVVAFLANVTLAPALVTLVARTRSVALLRSTPSDGREDPAAEGPRAA